LDNIKQKLSYLILGQQEGQERIEILEHLKQDPYSINQLAKELDLDHTTVKHNIETLLEYELVRSSENGSCKLYSLSPSLKENYDMLKGMKKKLELVFRSPKLFERVVQQTHEGIIILDENKRIVFINKIAEKMIGHQTKYLLGKNLSYFIEADIDQSLESVSTTGEPVKQSIRIETKPSETKTLMVTLDHFHFEDKENENFFLLMKDISKKTEKEGILDAVTAHSDIVMAYLDTDFNLLYVNSAYAKMTAKPPEDLIGENHFRLFPSDKNKKMFKKIVKEGKMISIKGDHPLRSSDSGQESARWILTPVKDNEDDIRGLLLTFSPDISDLT